MLSWFERLEEGLIAFLLAFMTLLSFSQVIARYVFNYSFVWALELVTFCFAWLIFLGMAYGVRVGSHIGVDALVKSLGPVAARRVSIVATVGCIVYAGIVFIGSWNYVAKMVEIGTLAQDMPVPLWVPRLALPVGFAILFLRFIQVLVRLLRGQEVHLLGDEAEEMLKQKADFQDSDPEAR
ncbi:MAG: TRAP transporter small permease [Casimicrobiaceae bacterium]